LEGTFKGHLVQPPCSEQGQLPLDQVAKSPVVICKGKLGVKSTVATN